jgi:hypothetical protein
MSAALTPSHQYSLVKVCFSNASSRGLAGAAEAGIDTPDVVTLKSQNHTREVFMSEIRSRQHDAGEREKTHRHREQE